MMVNFEHHSGCGQMSRLRHVISGQLGPARWASHAWRT